ncbi:PHP domain-containing protein [Halalkalibacter akibai]|uniref:Metal-dependent phosphoesterases n=1 Tax=Halalkalibacter akibai (strain ATCC 43226 / DSM 21942 / CIP 109018 / JCM 9157 / 1139) TaxID=1236973 RepID=W4QWN5_HALA3|nr:PHP domain-containing protein [Halalkalibacter akibai]GAE35739.1 metal-dependent phosphoesterases [Halalkalibacter akibai JCM 9157]
MNHNSDLHMHSTASDGGYSPSELMKKCKDVQLKIVSLTDHDSVDGLEEAIQTGEKLGIQVIPGIEFSTKYKGKSVHILGYQFDWKDEELQRMLALQKQLRRERLDTIIEKLAKINLFIEPEQVIKHTDGGSIGRPHVAKALIEAGYVKDVAEAFDRFLAEGQAGYVEKSREMSVKEAIDWIHGTNGIAIVAHPDYYGVDGDFIDWVREWGLDGIEIYHRDHDEETVKRYEELTEAIESELGVTLYRTGGSDFHHEEYGRVREPLGITRLSDALAQKVANIRT